MSTEFYWVAVVLATIIASARVTRLLTFDKFPPVAAVRNWYADKTDPTDWQLLALCGYCMSFWVVVTDVALGWWAQVYGHDMNGGTGFLAWWVVNGVFAMTYLAAMTMARDGDKSAVDPRPAQEPSFRRQLALYVATGQATPEQVVIALRIDEGKSIDTGEDSD